MKIATIIENHPKDAFGGAEYQLWLISSGLAKLGHRVTFITLNNKEPERTCHDRVFIVRIPGQVLKPNELTKILRHELSLAYDVVLLREFSYISTISNICKEIGVPLVFSVSSLTDCMPFLPFWLNYRPNLIVKHYRNFASISRAQHVVCQTFDQANQLKKFCGRPIDVIYNGHPLPVENRICLSQNILWVGNIKRIKRPELFVKLANKLSHTNITFTMVGRSPGIGRYERKFQELLKKAPKNFKYLGSKSIEEVNELLNSALILANTSYKEGFPNIFIQAWMRHVPVVSFSFDPDNLIVREGLGRCSKNFAYFANDIEELANNQALWQEVGERARQFSIKNLSWEILVKRYEQVLLSVNQKPLRA